MAPIPSRCSRSDTSLLRGGVGCGGPGRRTCWARRGVHRVAREPGHDESGASTSQSSWTSRSRGSMMRHRARRSSLLPIRCARTRTRRHGRRGGGDPQEANGGHVRLTPHGCHGVRVGVVSCRRHTPTTKPAPNEEDRGLAASHPGVLTMTSAPCRFRAGTGPGLCSSTPLPATGRDAWTSPRWSDRVGPSTPPTTAHGSARFSGRCGGLPTARCWCAPRTGYVAWVAGSSEQTLPLALTTWFGAARPTS